MLLTRPPHVRPDYRTKSRYKRRGIEWGGLNPEDARAGGEVTPPRRAKRRADPPLPGEGGHRSCGDIKCDSPAACGERESHRVCGALTRQLLERTSRALRIPCVHRAAFATNARACAICGRTGSAFSVSATAAA